MARKDYFCDNKHIQALYRHFKQAAKVVDETEESDESYELDFDSDDDDENDEVRFIVNIPCEMSEVQNKCLSSC